MSVLKDLLRYPLGREGVFAPGGCVCLIYSAILDTWTPEKTYRERLIGGTVPPDKTHPGGTVPPDKTHPEGPSPLRKGNPEGISDTLGKVSKQ